MYVTECVQLFILRSRFSCPPLVRLFDGAGFRRCVSCMDPTLIPLGNQTDQTHVPSALHGEDEMDISTHGRLSPSNAFICCSATLTLFQSSSSCATAR
ncbi:hypothetical protein V8C34DRAFT_275155 [Trichoderma compactum]